MGHRAIFIVGTMDKGKNWINAFYSAAPLYSGPAAAQAGACAYAAALPGAPYSAPHIKPRDRVSVSSPALAKPTAITAAALDD